MTKLASFSITGNHASFRDPSITSNQTVYYVPSKTAIVGILGGILGISRTNTLDELYSSEYLDFFSKVKIGLELQNNPKKIIYFTNHRSFEKSNMKPVKKELLENPQYTIFVKSTDEILDKLQDTIQNNKYHFTPYLGHAYCPATLTNFKIHEGKKIERVREEQTCSVVLDETDTFNDNFVLELSPAKDEGSIIIERHLHHFYQDKKFGKRVLKHWVPLNSTVCNISNLQENKLSEFYKINEMVFCLY